MGNINKESRFVSQSEHIDYSHTDNNKIKTIFGKARTNMSDEELNELKKDPQKFAEVMYGGGNKIGRGMGNTSKGDAWKYRGRGFIQLTGKQQYSDASKSIFGDDRLVKDPDLANDPNVAAQIAVDYLDRD